MSLDFSIKLTESSIRKIGLEADRFRRGLQAGKARALAKVSPARPL